MGKRNLLEIVLDIETVPRSDFVESDDPKHIKELSLDSGFGSIIAIGVFMKTPIGETSTYCMCGEDEKKTLEWFWSFMEEHVEHEGFYADRPYEQNGWRLITYNGKKFDVPYILVRSAYNNVMPTRDISLRAWETKNHLDLCEYLGTIKRRSLQHWLTSFDLPVKNMPEGESVYSLAQNGDLATIKNYCINDCEVTYLLYDRIIDYISAGDSAFR